MQTTFGIGGPSGSATVPPETLKAAHDILAALDADAIRAELARRKLTSDIEKLVAIADEEKRACRRTQSADKIRERSAQLLVQLAKIKSVEDLPNVIAELLPR